MFILKILEGVDELTFNINHSNLRHNNPKKTNKKNDDNISLF